MIKMNDSLSEKTKDKLHQIMDDIKQERDELHVKAHLARAEVRDEWVELEEKWEHLRSKSKRVGREAKGASNEVWAATKLLGEELKEGYQRIRKSL